MMPQSSQNLYFHLGMNADDDGFCEHFTIMRMTESKPDDLKILHSKGFVFVFDDRVLVILDWKENNYLRPDRYNPSKYLELYKNELLNIPKNIAGIPSDIPLPDTGKVRLGKDRKGNKKDVSAETLNSFNIFWELYNRKVNKEKALQLWIKIKPELHTVIYEHVKKYRKTDSGKNFPYHPNNYLKGEHWNDDLSVFNKSIQTKPQEKSYREQLDERYPLI